MSEPLMIQSLNLASNYLSRLNKEGYKIIDLNMIELFELEDKKYQPSNIVIERNQKIYSLRSDWTRSLLKYQNEYHLKDRTFGYFGPVLRDFETSYQAGAELYEASEGQIKDSILLHLDFIQNQDKGDIRTIIVNDEKLIDLYINKYDLTPSIKQVVFDKDISALEELLGTGHPLYQLMVTPVSKQLNLVKEEFAGEDHKSLEFLIDLKEKVSQFNADFILDLSFRSPQSYYNGFFIQAFLKENAPILTGGEYNHNSFGLAINLSNGGLL